MTYDYHTYLDWYGWVVVRHDYRGVPVRQVARFDYEDRATADAVCRDLNRSVGK